MVHENGDKVGEADAKSLEEAIEDAKKAMNEGGTARLRSATENIERQLHKVAEVLYKANQAAGAAQAGAAVTSAQERWGDGGSCLKERKIALEIQRPTLVLRPKPSPASTNKPQAPDLSCSHPL